MKERPSEIYSKIFGIISNEFLELIILPTEQCNFRCTYCYEDFSIGKMQPKHVEGIKKLISARATHLRAIKISWFGGEPLAAKDIVFDISQHISKIKEQNSALQYSGVMTTNGYHLNPETLKWLCLLGVNEFQISLDGPKELHNKTRLRADGSGTYDKIWQNLIAAHNTILDFSVTLRIHITPNNLLELPRLIDKINYHFKDDSRFSLFFKPVENLGGSNNFNVINMKDKQHILDTLHDLVDSNLKIEKIENRKPYVCYAAQTNSFVIRANARVGKCTVALNDTRNDIGELTENGELILDNEKFQPWIRGIQKLNLQNLECPMIDFPKSELSFGKHKIPIKVESQFA